MSLNTEIIWESPLFANPGLLTEELAAAAFEAADERGKEVDSGMENAPKSGTINPRTGKNRSVRFEPPAKDSGELAGSKSLERTGETETTLSYTAPHASAVQDYLERPILPDSHVPEEEERLARKVEERTRRLI